jgi:CBS domain-containing protein
MSPRAAWRLERLGFDRMYDYVGGKVDWRAAGLPTVRADASEPRAHEAVDPEPLTCGPSTPVSELPAGASVIVVDDAGIVLGRVPPDRDDPAGMSAEDVMRPGPTTARADEPLDPLLERMADRGVDEMIVTTPEGRLLGVVRPT